MKTNTSKSIPRLRHLLLLLLTVCQAGCSLFSPEPRSLDTELYPDAFQLYTIGEELPEMWWKIIKNNEIDVLINKTLEGNLTIAESVARLRQARATAQKSGAARYPELTASAGFSHSRKRIDTGSEMDGTSSSDTYSIGPSVSFEVDIWGRVAAVTRASQADLNASREDLRSAYLTVIAETVTRWLDLVTQKETLTLLKAQLKTNRQSLELMDVRYRLGQSTTLDVYQQRQSVAAVESLIPATEARIAELTNQLAVLSGAPSGSDLALVTDKLPKSPVFPDPGLPATVLATRPDVRRAGLALNAADWRVTAARADRLPALRLTASATCSAEELDQLFSNWISTLATNLAGPLFDSGRRKAEVARTRAVVDERLASYRKTVLNAIMEVENNLIAIESNTETLEAQTRQLAAAHASWQESLDRYRKGAGNYLPVLTALTQAQQLERTTLQSRYKLLQSHVDLCRSIGGTWMDEKVTQ